MAEAKREHFGGRLAIIMAMAGSAIGLGNIWRFPYLAGEHGGAAFIFVYIIASLFLSLPIFLAESIIGRRSHANTYGAMEKLAPGTKWKWMSILTIIAPLIIVSYYSVVGGWSIEYLLKSLTFSFNNVSNAEISSMFSSFIASPWIPIACHTVFLGTCAVILTAGVKSGIEKFSNWSVPILFILILVILLYSLTLPGAMDGVEYMIKPDFSKIDSKVILAAMGQSFYSLSLGVGTILVYSSYVSKKENLLVSGVGTAVFDLLFAIMAGFAVMTAVFSAGVKPGAGPGLIFESLPYVFSTMAGSAPIISGIIAIVFFVTILVSALTSGVSLMEVGVAYLVEEKKMRRGVATLSVFIGTWILGCLCSLSFGPMSGLKIFGENLFGFCDWISSNFLMALGALLFSLFVGWKMKKSDVYDEFTNGGTLRFNVRCFKAVYFLIRYIAPLVIAIIFISGLLL
ncbi:MAG: sodium-dependent transporter [Candidatus Cryptobacteroides sp.]